MRRNGEDQNTVPSARFHEEASPLLGPRGPFGESGSGNVSDYNPLVSAEPQELPSSGDTTTEVGRTSWTRASWKRVGRTFRQRDGVSPTRQRTFHNWRGHRTMETAIQT
jgi:hypothetical protein